MLPLNQYLPFTKFRFNDKLNIITSVSNIEAAQIFLSILLQKCYLYRKEAKNTSKQKHSFNSNVTKKKKIALQYFYFIMYCEVYAIFVFYAAKEI